MSELRALYPLIPVAGLCTYVACHMVLGKVAARVGFLKRLIAGFVGGILVTASLGIWLSPESTKGANYAIAALGTGLFTYCALGFCYLNFANAHASSLRIRLLREFVARHPAGLTRQELGQSYGAGQVLHLRLERLCREGQVLKEQDSYILKKKGLLFVSGIFLLLSRVMGGNERPIRRNAAPARTLDQEGDDNSSK